MKDKLKSLGFDFTRFVLHGLCSIFIIMLFIKGGVWLTVSAFIRGWSVINGILLLAVIFLLLTAYHLSSHTTLRWRGIYFSSFFFRSHPFCSESITYSLWGVIGIVIGLLLMGFWDCAHCDSSLPISRALVHYWSVVALLWSSVWGEVDFLAFI